MAQISRLHRLIAGAIRGVDLASNTVVVGDVQIGGLSGTILTKTILDRLVSLQDGSDVAATYHTHDSIYTRTTDLASTANSEGASLIGIEDAAAQFTAVEVEGALAEVMDAAQAAQDDATQALSDAADAQADATQALSDAAAAKAESAALVTLSGRSTLSTDLGTFTGTTIPDSATIKSALQSLETAFEGIPTPIVYKGTWNAATNTPALDNTDTGKLGYLYQVTVAGSVDFGAGSISFEPGDKVVNNGTIWDKWDMTDAVTSVNGQSGAVSLDTDDISEGTNKYYSEGQFDASFAAKDTDDLAEGATNKYFSVAAARAAAVVNSTAGSETDQAPSVSAIKSYVTSAVAAVSSETVQVLANAGESMGAAGLFALRWGKPADSETAGRLYKADNDATTKDSFRVVALIKVGSALSAGNAASAVKAGKLTATSHGFTIGEPIFLGATGALTQTAPSTDSIAVVCVGIARDANTIDVQIEIAGVN